LSFWYGIGFGDAAEMPMAAMEAYLERIPARQAELKLALADAVSLPHMKKNDRERSVREWERAANVDSEQTARVAPRGLLKLMGIGVRSGPLAPLSADADIPLNREITDLGGEEKE